MENYINVESNCSFRYSRVRIAVYTAYRMRSFKSSSKAAEYSVHLTRDDYRYSDIDNVSNIDSPLLFSNSTLTWDPQIPRTRMADLFCSLGQRTLLFRTCKTSLEYPLSLCPVVSFQHIYDTHFCCYCFHPTL